MPLSDYAHHNEEAQSIWWEDEGKHENEPPDYDPDFDDLDWYDDEEEDLDD